MSLSSARARESDLRKPSQSTNHWKQSGVCKPIKDLSTHLRNKQRKYSICWCMCACASTSCNVGGAAPTGGQQAPFMRDSGCAAHLYWALALKPWPTNHMSYRMTHVAVDVGKLCRCLFRAGQQPIAAETMTASERRRIGTGNVDVMDTPESTKSLVSG
eukprot:5326093-Amphidinium_carterae.1